MADLHIYKIVHIDTKKENIVPAKNAMDAVKSIFPKTIHIDKTNSINANVKVVSSRGKEHYYYVSLYKEKHYFFGYVNNNANLEINRSGEDSYVYIGDTYGDQMQRACSQYGYDLKETKFNIHFAGPNSMNFTDIRGESVEELNRKLGMLFDLEDNTL